jgi:hypothetical protein
MDKPTIILSAEAQFAREVTLSVIYQLPLPLWTSVIPGMFIFDFLRRNASIRRYTKHYLFPRKQALNASHSISNNEEKSSINEHIQNEIENWLNAQNILSNDLANAYKKLIDLLAKHYAKLMDAEGTGYYELIENAYASRSAFKKYLARLGAAEAQIDRLFLNLRKTDEKLTDRLKIEAQQVKQRRNKILEDIF